MDPWKIIGRAIIVLVIGAVALPLLARLWWRVQRALWVASLKPLQADWEPQVGDEVLVGGELKPVSRTHNGRIWVQTRGDVLTYDTEVTRGDVLFTGKRNSYVWRPS